MKHAVIPGETTDDGSEMIQQLKEKFLPKSWSVKKIQQEFSVSNYTARKSKELVKEKGIVSLPSPKSGPLLPSEMIDMVQEFHESDEITRVMPGKKDFVSVKIEGKCVHVQKQLVLNNLREVYHELKEKFSDRKIGFSKFAELRPKHFTLAGASGTHSACVCTIHQNKVDDV